MPTDHIRYDVLARDALRGVLRRVLSDAAEHGLPGEHHFFITFLSKADGVKLSPRLLAQYPEEMTIILQHQFWDLVVTEDRFEVGIVVRRHPRAAGGAVRLDQELFRSLGAVRPAVRASEAQGEAPAATNLPAVPPAAALPAGRAGRGEQGRACQAGRRRRPWCGWIVFARNNPNTRTRADAVQLCTFRLHA